MSKDQNQVEVLQHRSKILEKNIEKPGHALVFQYIFLKLRGAL